MRISVQGKYAIWILVDIAECGDNEYVTVKQLAQRHNISAKYLEHIVNLLSKAGFLRSFRGSRGGYQLAKPAKSCIVGQVLRYTEGNIFLVPEVEDDSYHKSDEYYMKDLWDSLNKAVLDVIDTVTIADLVEKKQKSLDWDFII